jgi:hypothetical protein
LIVPEVPVAAGPFADPIRRRGALRGLRPCHLFDGGQHGGSSPARVSSAARLRPSLSGVPNTLY